MSNDLCNLRITVTAKDTLDSRLSSMENIPTTMQPRNPDQAAIRGVFDRLESQLERLEYQMLTIEARFHKLTFELANDHGSVLKLLLRSLERLDEIETRLARRASGVRPASEALVRWADNLADPSRGLADLPLARDLPRRPPFPPSESTVTTEVDVNRYADKLKTVEGKMDYLETHFRVINERTAETTERLEHLKLELERQGKDVGHQLMVLDVGVKQLTKKTDALDQKTDALDQKTDVLDRRLVALDLGTDALDRRIRAVETTLTQKIDAVDAKLTGKIDAVSAELSRIATHLGVGGAPPPAGHP